ncbi:MAG: hypothetical protein LIO93_11240 [Bacteroidales bacterium]|nr:hypothetical protein [Bacteroidales bacterium]
MIKIILENIIKEKCPDLHVATIECPIHNSEYSPQLWDEIEEFSRHFVLEHRLEDIKNIPAIRATRQAYKVLGKDPNRYRPSAEALCRRLVRGIPLYSINTAVDLINLISLKTGYSIGGFDADLIQGTPILGIGKEDESFQAIGRGNLNIKDLPVYRDRIGGIGTPTSDEERTKIQNNTTHLFMIINSYSGKTCLEDAVNLSGTLLSQYLFNGKICDYEINLY